MRSQKVCSIFWSRDGLTHKGVVQVAQVVFVLCGSVLDRLLEQETEQNFPFPRLISLIGARKDAPHDSQSFLMVFM